MTTMRIAIPSMGDTLDSFLSNNLGRTPFIIIYDVESNSFQSFANTAYKIQDGSGLKVSEIIIEKSADVLLTREIGRKSYSALQKEQIKIQLLNSGGSVKSAINKYLKKQET